MHRRQPLPHLWMMTDERQGEALLPALRRLPEGAGIVFRHYSLAADERHALFGRVLALGRDRRCAVLLAATPLEALEWGADGSHGWEGKSVPGRLRSVSVHDAEELDAANRLGADLIFVSPIFETRSHPGRAPLGPGGFSRLAGRASMPAIALGGMNAERAKLLEGTYGWAGIDAWTSDT